MHDILGQKKLRTPQPFIVEPYGKVYERKAQERRGFFTEQPPFARFLDVMLSKEGEELILYTFESETDAKICRERIAGASICFKQPDGTVLIYDFESSFPRTFYFGGTDIVNYIGINPKIDKMLKQKYEAIGGFFAE